MTLVNNRITVGDSFSLPSSEGGGLLTVNKNDFDAADDEELEEFNLLISRETDDNNTEVGIGFRISTNQDSDAQSPGGAVTFERIGTRSKGQLHFKTKNSTGAVDLNTRMTISPEGNVDVVAHNGSSAGLKLGGTLVTAAATELNYVDGVTSAIQTQLNAKAPIANPTFTGTPAAPTAAAGTSSTQLATTAFVGTAVANLVDSAPSALDTLNELAAALGDDASFSTTITNSIATKAPVANPTFTGEIGIGSVNVSETELGILEGASLTTTELNYLDITTLGTVEASKAVTADANGHITIPQQKELRFDSSVTRIYANADDPEDLIIEADQDLHLRPDNDLYVWWGTTARHHFDGSTNRVGIAKTNPTTTLDVNGAVTATSMNISATTTSTTSLAVGGDFGLDDSSTIKRITLTGGSGADAFVGFGEDSSNRGWIGWHHSDNKISIGSNGHDNSMVVKDGKVGIGTVAPQNPLDIYNMGGLILAMKNNHYNQSGTGSNTYKTFSTTMGGFTGIANVTFTCPASAKVIVQCSFYMVGVGSDVATKKAYYGIHDGTGYVYNVDGVRFDQVEFFDDRGFNGMQSLEATISKDGSNANLVPGTSYTFQIHFKSQTSSRHRIYYGQDYPAIITKVLSAPNTIL